MTTTAQNEANKRWAAKNRDRARYLRNRSTARTFIRRDATQDDLSELKQMIADREVEINKD